MQFQIRIMSLSTIAILSFLSQCSLGQPPGPPGCFYGVPPAFVPWCHHGLWHDWNCTTCATVQQATRERELCCKDQQMSKQDCYKACSLDIVLGIEHDDCTTQCGFSLKPCVFNATHETINLCEFSSWLAWDCTKCPDNWPGNTRKTDRKRAICCGEGWLNDVESCLKLCAKQEHSDTDIDYCVNVCPLLSSTSKQVQTTTPTTTTKQATSTPTTISTTISTTASRTTPTTTSTTSSTTASTTTSKTARTTMSSKTKSTTPTTEPTPAKPITKPTINERIAANPNAAITTKGVNAASTSGISENVQDTHTTIESKTVDEINNKEGSQDSMDGDVLCKKIGIKWCYVGPWKIDSDPNDIFNTCTLIMMGVTFFLLLVILVLAVTACNLRTAAEKIKPFAKRHQVMPSPEVSNKRVHVTAARRRPSNPSAPSNAGFLDVGSVQSQSPQTSPSPRNRSFYSNC